MTIDESGFLGIAGGGSGSVGLVVALDGGDIVGQSVFGLGREITGDSPVGLVDFAFAKHLVEAGKSLGRLGEHYYTPNRTVEAMYDTEKYVTGLGMGNLDPFLHSLAERSVAGLVTLDDFTGGFVDDNNMIVFVEYFHNMTKLQKNI